MPTFHRYRATIFSVSLALLLSSVGLPVIVVACEMGTMVAVRGCGVLSRRGAPSDMSITRIPCRAHYRYIEGNATAYVPVKRSPHHVLLQLVGIVPRSLTRPNWLPHLSAVLQRVHLFHKTSPF